ncbi:MAG TPA: serine/threonine-protein kinase [Polyangiaceae bacterium]|nr:serine/threonine-protein kinase [Polyangiaceae bacterium]
MADSSILEPGTLLADKFRIVKLLGAGAMGSVYLIRHEVTHHQRALKLLHTSSQAVPEIVRRFLNEASAAGRAGNPHLVETFDGGTLPTGEPYLVMEFLDGETLSALVRRQGPLDVALACELVAQAAEGIEAAHQAGIVHRDIKSDNLFVAQREGAPFVKILDFGVSKFRSGASSLAETAVGQVYGTPAYMAPEQLEGSEAVGERADVFSLGVVLYECLAGQRPFDERSFESLRTSILQGNARPLTSVRADLPPALVQIVACALASALSERFPSARALAQALQSFRGAAARRVAPLATLAEGGKSSFTRTQTEFARPQSSIPQSSPKRPLLRAVLIAFVLFAALIAGGVLFRERAHGLSAHRVVADVPAAVVPAAKPASIEPPAAEASVAGPPQPAVVHREPASTIEPTPRTKRDEHSRGASRERLTQGALPKSSATVAQPAASAASVPALSAAERLGLREVNPFQ